jgi:hypothetical protein
MECGTFAAQSAVVDKARFVPGIARVMHLVGMVAPELAKQQFIFRGAGAIATGVFLVAAALALMAALKTGHVW